MNMTLIPIMLYLMAMIGIAWRVSRIKNSSETDFLEEYFIGSRSMGGLVLAMTVVATYVGASSFIGGPGVAYKLGLGWVLLACIQTPTAFLTLGVLGKKMAIISRKINGVTISDYLRARYDNELVVIFGSVAMVFFFIGAVVVQFIGGARLFESVTGLPYISGLLIFALVVVAYTTIGGFRAVTLTDAIQGVVMLIATGILFISLLNKGGGMENIMKTIYDIDPNLLTPTAGGQISKPFILSFWMLVGVAVLGLPPTAVRCMGFRDTKSMHNGMILGTSVVGVLMLGMHLVGFMGIAIDPNIDIGDKAIPILAMNNLHPIVAGVFIAGPLAAIMSTIDSLLILSSATIIKDLYIRYILKGKEISEKKIKMVSQTISLTLGITVFFLALNPPKLLVMLNLMFLAGQEAIFFCPIIFGLYWKKANATGALSAMIVGLGSYLFLFLKNIKIFGTHQIVPVIFFAVVAFVVGSLLGKPTPEDKLKIFFEDEEN
ncbi:MAG: sodium/pantothenate symporter [Fusobacteriaceae bacterium]